MTLEQSLADFVKQERFVGKGPLCVGLIITQHARSKGLPLDPGALLTEGGGQVLGLGKGAVQAVLSRHGITKMLASEGGRTSRGSIGNMHSYVGWLNTNMSRPDFNLDSVEAFWIERVREFFAAKPFMLRMDGSLGLKAVIQHVMKQAEDRQHGLSGTTIVGTFMQHMVGAKLDLVLGAGALSHHSANQNDTGSGRSGDFELGDTAIHVTAAAGAGLLKKCADNLASNKRPLIVTSRSKLALAEGLADVEGILARVDIVDFESFVATNLHELSHFAPEKRRPKIEEFVSRYNELIDAYETDPSLKIEVA